MKNKKGVSYVQSMIIVMVILLIFLAVYSAGIFPKLITGITTITDKTVPINMASCKTGADISSLIGGSKTDGGIDQDGLPDNCDNCVCSVGQGCHNGNDDEDKDGIPKACDENDKDGKPLWNKLKCQRQVEDLRIKNLPERCVLTN